MIFGSLIFATLLQPIYGAISDRIGRKPLLIFFGVVGTLATVPILTTLKETKSPFTAFLLICGAWMFVAGYTSINAVVKAELFPTNVRALGVGLPYAHHGIDVRRHGAGRRAVFQDARARAVVLLLSQRHDLPLAAHLCDHARHQARLRDASPRVTGLDMADENEPPPESKLTRSKAALGARGQIPHRQDFAARRPARCRRAST